MASVVGTGLSRGCATCGEHWQPWNLTMTTRDRIKIVDCMHMNSIRSKLKTKSQSQTNKRIGYVK